MTENPDTVDPETTIFEVAKMFSQNRYHALPVVENGILRGLISPSSREINVIKLRKYYCRQYWLKPPEDLLISYPFDKSNGNENNLLRIHCRWLQPTVAGMVTLQGFSQISP